MPRTKSFKALFLDVVVFVGMFALLGHLSISIWERFIIQSELSNVKTSLHSLKQTINKIGFAYDNLHQVLVGLTEIADKKLSTAADKRDPEPKPRKMRNSLDRTLHDIQMQAMVKAKNHTTSTTPKLYNKTVQNYMQEVKKNKSTQNFLVENKKCCLGKNISTITRYPTKSTGVGLGTEYCISECPSEGYCKYRSCTNAHRCCKEYDCFNPVDNWKF